MASNVVRKENNRTYETIPLGTIKFGTNGTPEAPGAATASIKGFVTAGLQQAYSQAGSGFEFPKPQIYGYLVTGVSSFTNVFVGAKIDDNGAFKIFPTATPGEILAIDEKAKTLIVGIPSAAGTSGGLSGLLATAQREILEKKTEEEAKGVSKAAEDTFTVTNFVELPEGAGGLSSGKLAAGAIRLVSSAAQFADFATVTVNILEGTATSKLDEVILWSSFDGGFTWAEAGKAAAISITEKGSGAATIALKEKLLGPSLAISFKVATAATKASGYVVVATDRVAETSVRNV